MVYKTSNAAWKGGNQDEVTMTHMGIMTDLVPCRALCNNENSHKRQSNDLWGVHVPESSHFLDLTEDNIRKIRQYGRPRTWQNTTTQDTLPPRKTRRA